MGRYEMSFNEGYRRAFLIKRDNRADVAGNRRKFPFQKFEIRNSKFSTVSLTPALFCCAAKRPRVTSLDSRKNISNGQAQTSR